MTGKLWWYVSDCDDCSEKVVDSRWRLSQGNVKSKPSLTRTPSKDMFASEMYRFKDFSRSEEDTGR